jgi:4-aminobutyrate aminotransferase-like enzyme
MRGHDPTPESERGEVKYESERMTLNLYRARMLELQAEGADGVYLFNTDGREFIDVLSDIRGLRVWAAFEQPLIGWFEPVTTVKE